MARTAPLRGRGDRTRREPHRRCDPHIPADGRGCGRATDQLRLLPLDVLARAYDQANNADSTIAYLERYLGTTITFRINPDTWLLAPAHKRLGELYEARGDAKKAAEHYAAFVELWKHADPDLQPKVAEARTRLERVRRALPR